MEGVKQESQKILCCAFFKDNLESNVTLGRDGNTADIGSTQSSVDVCGPVVILPFNIDAFIRLDGGGQGIVVTKGSFPFNGDITIAVDSGRDLVVIIDLLRDGDFLVVSRCGQHNVGVVHGVVEDKFLVILGCGQLKLGVSHVVLDNNFLAVGRCSKLNVGVTVVVRDYDIGVFGSKGVCRSDTEASSIQINSLGCRDAIDTTIGGCDDLHGKVGIGVVSTDFDVGASARHVLGGSGSNAPSSNVGLEGSENLSWERGDVGRWASSSFDSVVNRGITSRGASRPVEGGVQSINGIKVSIGDRDLQMSMEIMRMKNDGSCEILFRR